MHKQLISTLILASAICRSSQFLAQSKPAAPLPATTKVTVPFVGCKSDGQTGPINAPKGGQRAVNISVDVAKHLAYYQAEEGFGVLAPIGWHCFATYGSSGGSLFVSPQPIDPSDPFSDHWKGFTGPAIQISDSVGDTSGRFEVAKTIARVFPVYKSFLRRVIAEGIRPASSFPSGPYASDKLQYRSKELVEYETPAQSKGLGTDSWLRKNDSPIRGIAYLLGETPDLLYLAVRLPKNLSDLTSPIVAQAEHDGANRPSER